MNRLCEIKSSRGSGTFGTPISQQVVLIARLLQITFHLMTDILFNKVSFYIYVASGKPVDCLQNIDMTMAAICYGVLILSTFEGYHTGPNQYNLRLSCIHKRTLNNLNIWKKSCSLLTWSKTPKSQKSQLYWSKTSKFTFTRGAYQPLLWTCERSTGHRLNRLKWFY